MKLTKVFSSYRNTKNKLRLAKSKMMRHLEYSVCSWNSKLRTRIPTAVTSASTIPRKMTRTF